MQLTNRMNNKIKHQSDRPVPLVARNDFLVEKVKTINTNNIFEKNHEKKNKNTLFFTNPIHDMSYNILY